MVFYLSVLNLVKDFEITIYESILFLDKEAVHKS